MGREGASKHESSSEVVAELLLDIGAVHFNFSDGFTFASGLRSPIYIDHRIIAERPEHWGLVTRLLGTYRGGMDVIAGVATGGLQYSAPVAFTHHLPHAYVRKQQKEYGAESLVEGASVEGKKVLLVEDMVTTGGSVFHAVDALYAAGAAHVECVAVNTYGFASTQALFEEKHIPLSTLTTVNTLLKKHTNAVCLPHNSIKSYVIG